MRYEIGCLPYDPQAQGKPWIALVVGWQIPTRPSLRWGFCHQPMAGSAAFLSIDCPTGAIVRYGYRDYATGESVCYWSLTCDDGSLEPLDAAEAHRLWSYRHRSDPSSCSRTRSGLTRFVPRVA